MSENESKDDGQEGHESHGERPEHSCRIGATEVLIIGTAHVSANSVADVERAFEEFKPDAVCVELCKPRYEAMRDPDRWRKLDLARLIKDKKLGLLASSLILSSFQKKIGETTGVKPGAEMLRAATLAEGGEKKLVLADREIRATLMRAWGRVGFFSKLWLISTLLASLLVHEDVEPEEIERLKREDVLADLFKQLPRRYDSVKHVIIDERDAYLAEKIVQAAEELERESQTEAPAGPESAKSVKKSTKKGPAGKAPARVLAVVGAGHLAGIARILEARERSDLAALDVLPPKKRLKTIVSWVLLSLIVVAIMFWAKENPDKIKDLLLLWVMCRSLGSGIGAILARAHPLSILVTMVLAPVSIFIFVSRLWMYPALVELWLNKPRVEDFENIASDTDTVGGFFKSMYSNRVLHLFMIIFLVSTGLTIGNLIFGVDFIQKFARQFF